jgi:hypothetical protein
MKISSAVLLRQQAAPAIRLGYLAGVLALVARGESRLESRAVLILVAIFVAKRAPRFRSRAALFVLPEPLPFAELARRPRQWTLACPRVIFSSAGGFDSALFFGSLELFWLKTDG